MKKKLTAISLVVAIVAIAVVGGSLAWFADTDEATNTFTIGSIDIIQNEVFDETTAQLLPVVGTDPTVATDNYIEKKVTVENVGKNDAYVQTYVAVPAVLDDNGILKLYDTGAAANGWTKVGKVATNVTITGETELYNVYLYRYDSILAPTAETPACLEYVYIDSAIDLNPYDTNDDNVADKAYFVLADGTEITGINVAGDYKLNVYVATQGVQADGFAGAEAALTAAFGNHPWAV